MHDVPIFDRFAPVYDLVMPAADLSHFEPGLEQATGTVDCVLDVGGGTGRIARALDVDQPIVFDASRGMLRRARGHGLATVQGDVREWPIREEGVDAVLLADALHHFPDVSTVLAEAARVVRPGGVVVVRDFDPETLRGRALVAAEHLVGFDSTFVGPDDLAGRLDDAGFTSTVLERGFGYTVVGRQPDS